MYLNKMRQITFARRHSIAENRKVPLNTVILPPLTPPPQDTSGTELLGKIVVNKSKNGTVNSEVVIPKPQETQKNDEQSSKTPEQMRLEQNIRFLQDQHQLILSGLHGEIEKLKSRNRELQFQLIFGKTPADSSSPSPSSPEEDSTKHKLYTSPKIQTNTTPLQVEILERELGELRLQLQEQESRNVYLSAIVDEQKKQLERYDRRREKEQQRTNAPGEAEIELLRKLEDAETLIRRLRRENSDLRRESQGMSEAGAQHHAQHHRDNNGYQSPRGQGHRGGSGRGHRTGNNGHYNNRGGWFPPLHSQSFWQGGRPQHDRSHHSNNGSHQDQVLGTNLPDIPLNDAGSYQQQPQPQYHGHGRKGSNNNHYHNGDGRRYRGQHKNNKPS
ncbi:unnamed protein product [Ceutorhynchus assimilis]|uniref:CCDC92/74 N-terminal domain-containing protein n=1 Tax=Ceutorhynchus assimilis TaxID=467358 RepID=A0A9N9QJX7_9CUCU|nr:unnamed protein product [Ceutorhynchus assimilis]